VDAELQYNDPAIHSVQVVADVDAK